MKSLIQNGKYWSLAIASLAVLALLSLLPSSSESFSLLSLLRLGLAMLAILSLIRATLPHLQSAKKGGRDSRNRLRLMETISLGGKTRISLIRVDRKDYLLGISSDSVRLLADLDSPQRKIEALEEEKLEKSSAELQTLLRQASPF
ncbi:MAG: flagellar biosynthetic protein FliO [Candidatus Krumholzibacteria bacterium]|jgi:flagellar protein FliO/FliZ|nr:flagellar biosynthetic protein FliO [Candidatus Krumholzibacteria bacterium]MDP6669853.1 flagellar biosynthetic protein FliO [Candidatus Krumholzibacteria bacterium]MDP6797082.1 flagellar biosynthetic protein FliO [Candidatus Krumholzibacteria bacterium]MDP7020942.1 flagellar biosynthetic protein FliO [Candidatus Krumholzibacteria bacterium]